jgi:3-hydroxybutyryl-CoA dehydrogenase
MEMIGVVGAGVMGRGIVQLFAQAGYELRLFDADQVAADKAVAFVNGMIDRHVAKAMLTGTDAAAIKARIGPCASLAGLAGCTIVIERSSSGSTPSRRCSANWSRSSATAAFWRTTPRRC